MADLTPRRLNRAGACLSRAPLPCPIPDLSFYEHRRTPLQITICPPAEQTVFFDEHAFQNPHRRTSAQAGLDFADYRNRCHTVHLAQRNRAHGGRNPAPWASCDATLRELLLVHLERRFYLPAPASGEDADARLARIEAAANAEAANGKKWLRKSLCEYVERKRRHPGDAAIQLQRMDTVVVMSQRGHAELLAALTYLYHRMGYTSSDCAEVLSLKTAHVRQLLARLARTYSRFFVAGAPQMGTHFRRDATGTFYRVRRRLRLPRSEAQKARRAREREERRAAAA